MNHPSDVVIENPNEGNDTIIGYHNSLPPNVENLIFNVIAGVGNNLNNMIIGNSGINSINGLGGADTLTGGGGLDTFRFGFGQSTSVSMDRITDFAIGTDKIEILS